MTMLSAIPTKELPRIAWRRVIREIRTRTAPRTPREIRVGAGIEDVVASVRERTAPRFFGLIPEQAALAAQFYPEAAQTTISEALKIRQHKLDILGSGEIHLGEKIDWHTDFKSGHTWPMEHHTRLELTAPRGGFDVKVPWELSRFHHGLRLGQAYLYTMDERYAREIVAQIRHWIKENPYEFGVNWAGPMDVSIRAANWIWCLYAIYESDALTDDVLALWLTSLRQHGEYIEKHLEDGWPRTNHLIANLCGLAYLGIMFPEFDRAAEWKRIGLTRLWEEIERQINPDGLDYESSLGYHRLVTEMVLSVIALCVINGINVPDKTYVHVNAMLDAIMLYTRPNGLAPQIGDFDSGRFLPLSVYEDPMRQQHDHRYLLALGSIILEREHPDWAGYADPTENGWAIAAEGEWQDAFWYFASDAAARLTDVLTLITDQPENKDPYDWVDVAPGLRVRANALGRRTVNIKDLLTSRAHEASGLYVMREDDLHMTVNAGDVGTAGAGSHAHNDLFGITLHAYDETFLIDPGSYLYTADPRARNLFRSTAFHNVLQVEGEEIIPLPKDELFSLPSDVRISIHRWVSNNDYDLLDASHDGYARLDNGVLHRRQIWFDKKNRLWILRDWLAPAMVDVTKPTRNSNIDLWFHFAPMQVQIDEEHGAFKAKSPAGPGLVILPYSDHAIKPTLEDGWYSPRYGVKERAPVARYKGQVKLPADIVTILAPRRDGANMDIRKVRSMGHDALLNMRRALSPTSSRFN